MSTKTMKADNAQSNSNKLFTKEWLIEQKSLIALIFLIVVVSFLNPNFFYCRQHIKHSAPNLG